RRPRETFRRPRPGMNGGPPRCSHGQRPAVEGGVFASMRTRRVAPSSAMPSRAPAGSPPSRTIAFIVTEDWFFASHFLPMALAARELGLEVVVVTRVRDHRAA